MDDDRIERLLKGYRLPEVSRDLDRRVLSAGEAILAGSHPATTVEHVGRSLLHRFGFGYLTWLVDFVTATDAEYRVEFI